MSTAYSTEEDVTLLQAVLQSGAHLRFRTDQEINPIKHCISKPIMNEVAEKYRAIKREEGFRFPPRTNKGLSHRFRNIVYRYGVGSLAETGTEEVSLLRLRLLNKIVRDRENRNEKKRKRSLEFKTENCEEEPKELPEGRPKKKVWVSLRSKEKRQSDTEEPSDPRSDGLSPSEEVSPTKEISNTVGPESKLKVKKERELVHETVVNSHGDERARCLQFIVKMLGQSEERRFRMEERTLAMEEALLGTKEVSNKSETHSKEDFQYGELRLECMKTILAKREVELRGKELEMRQREKMLCMMEKMLG